MLLQENILKKIAKIIFYIFLFIIFVVSGTSAKEIWKIDKNLSNITFEVPVLFSPNVIGEFKKIDGYVEIDIKNKQNNKAILLVELNSVEINYDKYRDLLLGPIFFDAYNHPISVIDTKKFTYENEKEVILEFELTIKGISNLVQAKLKIKKITNTIVQVSAVLEFSRTDFNIGIDSWSNTAILKDNINIKSDIFLIKE